MLKQWVSDCLLDDRLFEREYELAVNFITPLHEHSGKEAFLKTQSMARDEVMVVLPQDDLLLRDVVMYKKTEKYIRLYYSTTQQDAVKRILDAKSSLNTLSCCKVVLSINHIIDPLLGHSWRC